MVMDQQAAMERLQELYREKNEHLEKFLEPVTPFEFYREIFPVGSFERKGHFEDAKGNGIAVTVPPKAAGIALEIKEEARPNAIPSQMNCRSCRSLRHGFYHHVSYLLFRASAVRQKCTVSLCPGL